MKRKRQKISRMFTLMEMVVVIGIILLLASMALPAYFKIQDNANKGAAKAQIKSFETAIASFRLDLGAYPKSLNELVSSTGSKKWNGPYLGNTTFVPKDPWGNDYVYHCPGADGRPFEIVSYGSDGAPGGSGSAADISNYLTED